MRGQRLPEVVALGFGQQSTVPTSSRRHIRVSSLMLTLASTDLSTSMGPKAKAGVLCLATAAGYEVAQGAGAALWFGPQQRVGGRG